LTLSQNNWIEFVHPDMPRRLGRVRHALFDFDGTLSVLRQGWEPVMEAVMLEAISPLARPSADLIAEVRQQIDRTTGQLTILQMRWLEEAVRHYGLAQHPLLASEYKKVYLQALMVSVSQRLESLESKAVRPEDFLVSGAAEFLEGLYRRGVKLYIASGSDHPDVLHEASALGLTGWIQGGIYGALDASEANGKERIIQRILDEHQLAGDELLVVGDGPVEIIEANQRGAIPLGVASDEVARRGWNPHKIDRLKGAGAGLLVADFTHFAELVDLLAPMGGGR
jgi:phosphoglycolate phosphatase-like HAD superfamily hydrolase